MNINILDYNYSEYKYMNCTYTNKSMVETVNVGKYNSNEKFTLSAECIFYDIQLGDLPRIMSDLSNKYSSSIDRSYCFIMNVQSRENARIYNSNDAIDDVYLTGTIIKIYVPKYVDHITIIKDNGDVAVDIVPSNNIEWNSYLSGSGTIDGYGTNYPESYSIDETEFCRTITILISGNINQLKYLELGAHLTIPYNNHQSQSVLTVDQIKPLKFLSNALSNIIFLNTDMSELNGTLICDDFSKFFVGTPLYSEV